MARTPATTQKPCKTCGKLINVPVHPQAVDVWYVRCPFCGAPNGVR